MDIAVVVDAMTAPYTGTFAAFALVSSGGDSTQSTLAIREIGAPVYVFGTKRTPSTLRYACTKFHLLDASDGTEGVSRTSLLGDGTEFFSLVRSLLVPNGQTKIQAVNNEATKRYPNFAPRTLGAPSLKVLLARSGEFELLLVRNGSGMVKDYLVLARSQSSDACRGQDEETSVWVYRLAWAGLGCACLFGWLDHRVMKSITRFITQRLKLKVNGAKSAVARPQEPKFLGFSLTSDPEIRRAIAPKALARFKNKIREITRQAKVISIETTVKRLATYMVGWRGHFGFCETPEVLISA